MKKNWKVKVLGLLLCLVLGAGCVETALMTVGAVGAVGAYKWIEGTMEKEYPRPLPDVWQAVMATVEHFRWKIAEKQITTTDGKLIAVKPDGKDVKITLVAEPNMITKVGVRFGMFGDREASYMFHTQIMKELGL
jgi:hypothetical protein